MLRREVLIAAGAILASPAWAEDTPGVTDTEIKIGNTAAYSGPASAYGIIARHMSVNAATVGSPEAAAACSASAPRAFASAKRPAPCELDTRFARRLARISSGTPLSARARRRTSPRGHIDSAGDRPGRRLST